MTSTESQRSTEVERLPEDIAREVAAELREQGFEVYDTDVFHEACGEWVYVLDIDKHECPSADWR